MSQSNLNVEFKMSLDIAVTTSLRDDMTKGSKESGKKRSICLHHAAVLELLSSCSECLYTESDCFFSSVLSLSLKLIDADKFEIIIIKDMVFKDTNALH